MKRIALIHNKFSTTGGAETVFMNCLAAIQDRYSVTVFSFDEPDFEALNAFCGTDVDPVPVRRPGLTSSLFNGAVSAGNTLTNGRFGPHLQLKTTILNRFVRDRTARFDLRLSTGGELALRNPSVQYVHFPRFNRRRLDGPSGASGRFNRSYDRLCSLGAGVDGTRLTDATLLTNSEWTARRLESVYDASSSVLYPPVDVGAFRPRPWAEREPGFVTIGRISPDKYQLRQIEIVRRVRERGHDVHLHVVGPSVSYNSDYVAAVEDAAAADFVTYDGPLSREELIETVCSHRYGLHGKPGEHFGIAVAELVAGGTLPFVPDSGGQVELVGGQPPLCYDGVDDAVDRIDAVLSDPDRQRRLREGLPDVAERFDQERFQSAITTIAEEALAVGT